MTTIDMTTIDMTPSAHEVTVAKWEAARAKDGWAIPKGELANGRRSALRIGKGILSAWEATCGLAEVAEKPLTAEEWKALGRVNGVLSR